MLKVSDLLAPAPGTLDRLSRRLSWPPLSWVSRQAIRRALPGLRRLWPAIEGPLNRNLTGVGACCEARSVHGRFVRRYLDLEANPAGVDFVRRYMNRLSPARQATLIESTARVMLLGSLRHHLLARRRRRAGTPPTTLTEVQLSPYPDCNLSCAGCYSADDRQGSAPGPDQLTYLVDQAAECGAVAIHVAGKGEPFLTEARAVELLQVVASRPHLMFTIATNGINITPALARRLAALGNALVLIGVDGPRRIHDARRGPGTWRRVQRSMELLRRREVLFGFSCMVSRPGRAYVTSPGFIDQLTAAGCVIGVYSRYFPLSPGGVDDLMMTRRSLSEYRRAFDRTRRRHAIPLIDLDEIEEHTGCRSRNGASVYIDGVTSRVAPCIRFPFAPDSCRIDRERGRGLSQVLGHPFFRRYRRDTLCWCGGDPIAELDALRAELEGSGERSSRLDAYRQRWEAGAASEPRIEEANV